MLPLLAAATAGWYLLRGKTRKNPARRPHRRQRVSRNPVSFELSHIIEHALKLAKRGHWKAAYDHAGDALRLIAQRPTLAEYRGEVIELRNLLAARKLTPRWTNPSRKNPPIPFSTLRISRIASMTRNELIDVLRWETGGVDPALPTPELRRMLELEWSAGLDRNPGEDATSRAMVRAAISAILDMRSPKSFAKAKRKVPGLTQAEYAEALKKVSGGVEQKNPMDKLWKARINAAGRSFFRNVYAPSRVEAYTKLLLDIRKTHGAEAYIEWVRTPSEAKNHKDNPRRKKTGK